MKKYFKFVILALILLVFIGTFMFLYQKSKPKAIVYETEKVEVKDLQKTTVATGKI